MTEQIFIAKPQPSGEPGVYHNGIYRTPEQCQQLLSVYETSDLHGIPTWDAYYNIRAAQLKAAMEQAKWL